MLGLNFWAVSIFLYFLILYIYISQSKWVSWVQVTFNHHVTFWNININKFKHSSWTTFTGTTTTRTTNGCHFYHKNDGWGTGLCKGKDNRGSRSLRHDTSRASWYVFFFLFLNFYLLNVYFHLELPQWQWPATTTAHHLYPQNECRLEMQMHLEFWYVNLFFFHY